jgi:hypothetical protein
MIPLIDIPEQSFSKLEELRDTIASRDRSVHEVPISKISLSESGILHAGGFEGHLTEPALYGLLNTEGVPPEFAVKRCPVDLLVMIVGRIARELNISVLVQTVDGVATSIMPADRQPIRHDMLIDRLGVERPIKEATLGTDCLRITAVNEEARELLPNDKFAFGWELTTGENGWRSTEVWRWVVREICVNGAVGFNRTAIIKRPYNSREPVLVFLQKLVSVVDNAMQSPQLEPAIKWAADRRLNNEHRIVVNYLAQRLEGDTTKLALSETTADTTWYELLNKITSLARIHRLEMRRRYEVEGGMLLSWFLQQGRGQPPWRRMSCDECEFSNASEQIQ